jgi:ADP-ribose pyrophosphatase YjhB (NUDIX family)
LYPVRNSVKALIIHDNKLLCIRKSDKEGSYYILPGGGQEKNETFIETVKRECLEELGAKIRVIGLKYIREYIGKNHEFAGNDDNHQVEYMFECMLLTQPDETKANHIDDGQNGIQWIEISNPESYRVYPKVLMERLRSNYPEIYWGDVN